MPSAARSPARRLNGPPKSPGKFCADERDVVSQQSRGDKVMLAAIAEGRRKERRAPPQQDRAAAHQIARQVARLAADRQSPGDHPTAGVGARAALDQNEARASAGRRRAGPRRHARARRRRSFRPSRRSTAPRDARRRRPGSPACRPSFRNPRMGPRRRERSIVRPTSGAPLRRRPRLRRELRQRTCPCRHDRSGRCRLQ